MKKIVVLSVLVALSLAGSELLGQFEHQGALEGVIVETYYISDADDATDTDGGSLPEGSVTYRIYLDLQPGYLTTTMYGNEAHPLSIKTTTQFFNNEDRGERLGVDVDPKYLSDNTVALDSWVTIGAATSEHYGFIKEEDSDGSLVGGENSDGGSEEIEGGILKNDQQSIGIPLTSADGLMAGGVPEITTLGLDLSVLGDENDGPEFTTSDGGWSVLGGMRGPSDENKVLIAQITTDGYLSCALNVSIAIPDSIQKRLCHDTLAYKRECPIDQIKFVNTTDEGDVNPSETYYIYEFTELAFTAGKPSFINDRKGSLSSVRIFPNPSPDFVTLDILPAAPTSASYLFYDAQGREILGADLGNIFNSHKETIDVSRLEPGLYHVTITLEDEQFSTRFIKL